MVSGLNQQLCIVWDTQHCINNRALVIASCLCQEEEDRWYGKRSSSLLGEGLPLSHPHVVVVIYLSFFLSLSLSRPFLLQNFPEQKSWELFAYSIVFSSSSCFSAAAASADTASAAQTNRENTKTRIKACNPGPSRPDRTNSCSNYAQLSSLSNVFALNPLCKMVEAGSYNWYIRLL